MDRAIRELELALGQYGPVSIAEADNREIRKQGIWLPKGEKVGIMIGQLSRGNRPVNYGKQLFGNTRKLFS